MKGLKGVLLGHPCLGPAQEHVWIFSESTGPALTLYKSQRPRGLFPCPQEEVGLATAHTTTRSFAWVDLWSPSWQEQACERPEPCTWAGRSQACSCQEGLHRSTQAKLLVVVCAVASPTSSCGQGNNPRGLCLLYRVKAGPV